MGLLTGPLFKFSWCLGEYRTAHIQREGITGGQKEGNRTTLFVLFKKYSYQPLKRKNYFTGILYKKENALIFRYSFDTLNLFTFFPLFSSISEQHRESGDIATLPPREILDDPSYLSLLTKRIKGSPIRNRERIKKLDLIS